LQDLFDKVREEASRSAWSRGVELARTDAVYAERKDADALCVRVRPSAGVIHPSVILYPADAEWECDCATVEDPCEHVAAAAIALRRARAEGRSLGGPSAVNDGRIQYRFTTSKQGISLERVVCHRGSERVIETTLTALASGRVDGPPVSPGQLDLAVERALGPRLRGVLPRGVLRSLLRPLARCDEVQLDEHPVRTSSEPVGIRARIVDHPRGFEIRIERDPPVDRELPDGFALCGDTLRVLGPSHLTGREQDALQRRWVYSPDQVTELLAQTIPSLESRMPVILEASRLPSSTRVPPHLHVETSRADDQLHVVATLVYGDPPCARVDAGRLTHLQGPVPLRDEAAEARLVRILHDRLGLAPGRRAELQAADAIEWLRQLKELDVSVAGTAQRDFFLAEPLEASLELDPGRFAARFVSTDGRGAHPRQADPRAVLRAWRQGEPLVPLAGGGFAPLPSDWLERHGARLADLLAARDGSGRLPGSALPDLARLCAELEQPPPPGFEGLAPLLDDFAGLPAAPLPQDLRAELRPYQRTGIDWLHFLAEAGLGGLLADDMGLGKTLEALCVLRSPALVIAPTSLIGNWRDEIARFRPQLRARVYHGGGRSLDPSADVTLTSYALLRLDQPILAEVPWACVVLDEAQAIKNPHSQVAQAAFSLRAPQRITLTGTPVENRLEELWSQLHFLNPGLLGGRREFDERYARPIGQGDTDAAARLRERVHPFLLRRRKDEVAPELPPRTNQVLRCRLSDEEREVYDAVRAATRKDVVQQLERGGGVMAALEALLRLRQACCHPALLPGQDLARSSKLELLLDRLETALAEGHKALVFSQWTSLLDLLEPRLRAAEMGFVRLDGSTRDRSGVVARFQSKQGPPIFLISLRAGGTGLNLTAADHVFLLDPWWNPAVEDQAADRAHRIGQERPVLVHRLVAEETVEERILELQERKRSLAEAALGGGGGSAAITREELLALLA